MKRFCALLCLLILLCCGCGTRELPAQVAATTLPVYEFTTRLCHGTGITVTRLVTESVSCLHDYSLNVRQVKAAESAEFIVISGAGLEEFMEDILHDKQLADASFGISLLCPEEAEEHDHDHGDHGHEGHHHEEDPHIWLSPANAKIMAQNICDGLGRRYSAYSSIFQSNLQALLQKLDALQTYGEETLTNLSNRELITFHDGFAYFAHSFDLHILEAVEEESGSEASAKELKHLIGLVRDHQLAAIFTERNGSESAANVIARETGIPVFQLDMAMSSKDYFKSMYDNINTIKEALE